MSYRVDIPTLSANEVYTLTFEYEGTETIQLIVGDLTLETTDRRVVFTTTSPVNYIESNVNLTNLNMYEGYYESDDFGGEYTQESYIEGKSLVNLCEIKFIDDTSSWKYQMTGYDEEGYMHIIPRLSGHTTYYKVYPKDQPWRTKYGTYTLVIDFTSTLPNKTVDSCWESSSDTEKSQQKYKDFTYNSGQSRKIVVTFITSETQNYYIELNLGDLDLTTNTSGEIIVSYMVVEGDYFDEFCKEEKTKSWVGIGCVKSPAIKSLSPENLYISPLKYRKPLRGYEYYHNDGTVEIYPNGSGAYSTIDLYTGEDVGMTYLNNQKTWYVNNGIKLGLGAGTYYFRCEIELVANKQITDFTGRPQVDVIYDNAQNFNATKNNFTETYDGEKYYYKGIYGASYKTVTDDIRGIYVGIWSHGISGVEKYVIRNITLTKEASLKDICAISKSSMITTPDDLELYELNGIFDKLDLTSGIVTKYIGNNNGSLYLLDTPTTEQLTLNPLKSYRNGSIQTSSQQLAPTLKTTLPISNKFITTNLTSGSTYNVYFDGTATKLDAGGTIITDPVSPCEVECGGTTLTIEGTDIQNVRVLETTNKNEVGSVCGTTDVELSRITSKCGIHNLFDDYFQGSHSTQWAKDYYCTSTRDDTTVKIVGEGPLNYAGYSLVAPLPFGTYKLHYKVKVSTIGDKYKVALSSNPNGTPPDAYVPVTDVTSTALVEEQTFVFYKKHITNMLFYTYASGQEIEYYDISLIKLSDEDITGTDTSSINYSQTISKLEQPIKLRSLGTTYDSYNPVTGELVKRIGVSETDGSYSVLSSPVVAQAPFGRYFTNIFNINTDMITNWSTTTTVNEKEITIRGTWFTSFGVPFEKGKKYTLFYEMVTGGKISVLNNHKNQNSEIITMNNWLSAGTKDVLTFTYEDDDTSTTGGLLFYSNPTGTTYKNIMVVEGEYSYNDLSYFEGTQFIKYDILQLYTNGQVKVYSDSDVYPTTILNGQSTNNYEINELNTSNNYTIRYDGTCESINLNGKSNEQGTNRIVETSTNGSGNLTFVNDSGDIDNVLLVQNDVREQEINHFTGLQTVEVGGLLVQNQRNMWTNNPNNYVVSGWQATSTHYIPVKPGEVIYGTWQWNQYAGMTQYDENFNQLMGVNFFGPDSYGTGMSAPQQIDGYYRNKCTILENARYVRFTIPTSASSTIMFYRGGYQTELVTPTDKIYQGAYIDLPQPVQLNSLPDGTCDTYNPITGEYVQNVGIAIMDENGTYGNNWSSTGTAYPVNGCNGFAIGDMASKNNTIANVLNNVHSANYGNAKDYEVKLHGWGNKNTDYRPVIDCGNLLTGGKNNVNGLKAYLKENPIILHYQLVTPIVTQLTPINIPTFEGGILQLITTDGKVFPMIEYSMPTNNRYDTSSWEAGAVYTQRNMTEAYFNESTTPMIPTETMTLTTDHISSGSIILNDNGNGLIVLKGNYTGRDIPYFTGMRSVEAIEVETTPSPDQPLFGKGGRK